MLIKLDLEKAFDRLEWSFIYKVLRFFNFPPRTTNLIMHCITTSSIGMLVNGTKPKYFQPSRGIGQGDSLSPYIFILCIELLSRLINYQVDINNWDPIKTSPRSSTFSHLLFADDITLMGKINKKTSHCIKNCLDLFSKKSGLTINKAKSKIIISPHCPKETSSYLQSLFGIKSTIDFGNYLGFQSLIIILGLNIFQFIIDRLQSRLAHRKCPTLSMVGRITLATSTLSTIPSHLIQYTLLPNKTINPINRIQCNFIWGTTNIKKKLHLISWNTVTKNKEDGGLGITKAFEKNTTSLMSLVWRLLNSSSSWGNLHISKYVSIKNTLKSSFIWKSILHGWKNCNNGILWHPSYHSNLNIWYNNWIYNSTTLRSNIEGPLTSTDLKLTLGTLHGNRVWDLENFLFHLPCNICSNINLTPVPPSNTKADGISWKGTSYGIFTTKSCYKLLSPTNPTTNNYSWIWGLQYPSKIKIPIWKCSRNCLPSRAYLKKIGMNIDDTCTTCRADVEDISHIFVYFASSRNFWKTMGLCLDNRTNNGYWLTIIIDPVIHHNTFNIHWTTLFPFCLRESWKNRNNNNINNLQNHASITSTLHFVWEFHFFTEKQPFCNKQITVKIILHKPLVNTLKLNCDAAFSITNKSAGLGGCLRNNKGDWIVGYQKQSQAACRITITPRRSQSAGRLQ